MSEHQANGGGGGGGGVCRAGGRGAGVTCMFYSH